MEFQLERASLRQLMRVHNDKGTLSIEREGGPARLVRVISRDDSTLLLEIDGRRRRLRYWRQGRELFLSADGHAAHFVWLDEEDEQEMSVGAGSPIVRAPMPGRVLEVLVAVGDLVEAGQPVVRVEAMKMEIALEAGVSGVVKEVNVAPDTLVQPNDTLVRIQADGETA